MNIILVFILASVIVLAVFYGLTVLERRIKRTGQAVPKEKTMAGKQAEFCPLAPLGVKAGNRDVECNAVPCKWWMKEEKECVLVVIAKQLKKLPQ